MSDATGSSGESNQAGAAPPSAPPRSLLFRLRFVIPIVAFAALAVVLAFQLGKQDDGHSRDLPSALLDRPMPDFALPALPGWSAGLTDEDIRAAGVSMLNVFASWCGPCRVEHPIWVEYAKRPDAVPVFGLNYKDPPENATDWLKKLGDPYKQIGADRDGRAGIDWGVYGVPETFVIDREGRIVFKHVGVMTREDLDQKILPLIAKLKG